MTNTQIDLIEIKQILKKMQKDIARIRQLIRDDYFNGKIIDFYYGSDSWFDRCERIDELMNYYGDMKKSFANKPEISEMCDRILADLHDEYVDLMMVEE